MLNKIQIISGDSETVFEHFDITSDCNALFDFDVLPEGQQKDDFIAFIEEEISDYPTDFTEYGYSITGHTELTYKMLSDCIASRYVDADFAEFGYSFTWGFLRSNTGRRPLFAIPTGFSATVEYQELEEEVGFDSTPCTLDGEEYLLYSMSPTENDVYYIDRIKSADNGFSFKIKITKN